MLLKQAQLARRCFASNLRFAIEACMFPKSRSDAIANAVGNSYMMFGVLAQDYTAI